MNHGNLRNASEKVMYDTAIMHSATVSFIWKKIERKRLIILAILDHEEFDDSDFSTNY